MTEQQNILTQVVEQLFEELAHQIMLSEKKAVFEKSWDEIIALGITDVLIPETEGGFGGNWQDARIILHASGRFAVPLPIGETIIARTLLRDANITIEAGVPIFIATSSAIHPQDDSMIIELRDSVCYENDTYVLTVFDRHGNDYFSLFKINIHESPNECSPADTWSPRQFIVNSKECIATWRAIRTRHRLFFLGGLLRAVQMGGVLDKLLELTVTHVNTRIQFGRSLSKFQVVQHQLALLAEEAAAVNCAAWAACQALDQGEANFEIACAKLRANESVHQSTSIAHQLHGAIGFTKEHSLHRFTHLLLAWRSEFGNDRYWANYLGRATIRGGESHLWDLIIGAER